MENNDNNLADKEANNNLPASETKMPNDFWKLVQQQRAGAKALLEKRKQKLYQPFQEEGKANNPVPMPTNFWEAVRSTFDESISPPPETFELGKLYDPAEPTSETKQTNTKKQSNQTTDTKENESSSALENIKEILEEKYVRTVLQESLQEVLQENLQESLQEMMDDTFIEVPENEIIYLEQEASGLSFKEATLTILMREKRPMTAREIADIATKEGLIFTTGKTPDASIAGQISTDIKRNPNTPFAIIAPRTYILKIFNESEKNIQEKFVGNTQNLKPTFLENLEKSEEEVKGIVISGNFSKQEETMEKATKLMLSDSNLTTQIDDKAVFEKLTKDFNTLALEQEKSQKTLTKSHKANKTTLEPVLKSVIENPKMTFKQAAFYLLERMKRPMAASEIASMAIKESLVDSNSKKLDASIAGQLYTDLEKLGEKSVFRLVAPRTYGLADWYKKNET